MEHVNNLGKARKEEDGNLSVLNLKRALGAVDTPKALVEFMVALAGPLGSKSKVLEPACGHCPFLRKISEKYEKKHELVGVEINPEVLSRAKEKVPHSTLIEGDFLLWQSDEQFDLIIGNPPYGIIGDASHYPIHLLKQKKSIYKQKFHTWQGKYNIYGAFIEHSINLLKPNGKLIFVIPASWLILEDFTRLRLFIAREGQISIYYMGKVFPKHTVSCVVIVFQKGATGLNLYDRQRLALSKRTYNGEMIRFETPELIEFEQNGIPLEHLFEIRFAARSPEIRKHPCVSPIPQLGYVPILTGRNLKSGWIDYEHCYSGLWMPKELGPTLRFFYGFPHIVVGHTKGPRVVAALDEKCYPWREEFHLIPKIPHLSLSSIVQYLNSHPVQIYVQTLYRDFVPHLTLPMLKRVPIPSNIVSPNKIPQLPLEV